MLGQFIFKVHQMCSRNYSSKDWGSDVCSHSRSCWNCKCLPFEFLADLLSFCFFYIPFHMPCFASVWGEFGTLLTIFIYLRISCSQNCLLKHWMQEIDMIMRYSNSPQLQRAEQLNRNVYFMKTDNPYVFKYLILSSTSIVYYSNLGHYINCNLWGCRL